MSADRRPSYEELAAENTRLRAENAQLRADDVELRAIMAAVRDKVSELKRQMGQNSRNSSKPPSSDSPFAKPAPKSLRRTSGRKPGGPPGHPGSTLALVHNPSERKRRECGGCGASLANAAEVGMERRRG